MIRLSIGTLFMAASGCTPVPPPAAEEDIPVYGETGYTCDASRAQALVGRPATTELGAEALSLTGARMMRWIRPGDVITMELREDRLNIELDARNRVKSLRCG